MPHHREGVFDLKIAALLVLAGFSGIFPAAAPATELLTRQLDSAPAPLPQLEQDGPWLRVCEDPDGGRCHYEQTVQASNGDQIVLTLLPPSPDDKARRPVALFHTPLYALLPPGLTLTFDGKASGRIAFRACSPRGCIASVVLDGAIYSRMAGSNRVVAQFTTQTLEQVTAEFSLRRSAAILKAM